MPAHGWAKSRLGVEDEIGAMIMHETPIQSVDNLFEDLFDSSISLLPGNDALMGTDREDNLFGRRDDDHILGLGADDRIYGRRGDDTLDGGDDDDLLRGGRDCDVLLGGAGNDSLFGGRNEDLLFGGINDDFLRGGWGDDTLFGGDGADTLRGGRDNDILMGGADDDHVKGNRGEDVVTGGAGNDTVAGGLGDDTLVYVAAKNAGESDIGENSAIASALIEDETARDVDLYRGGQGNDTLQLEFTIDEWADEALRADVRSYFDTLNEAEDGSSYVFETLGLSVRGIEDLVVVVDGEVVDPYNEPEDNDDDRDGDGEGDIGDDEPEAPDSPIIGTDEPDILSGTADDDTIIGGMGDDEMFGDAGSDTFVIRPGDGNDTISDFDPIEDILQLEGGLSVQSSELLSVGGDPAPDFVLTLSDNSTLVLLDMTGPFDI